MSFDARLVPARSDIAAAHLRGEVAARRYVDGVAYCVTAPVLDLTTAPGGASLATQLRFGDVFTVYDEADGLAWGQAAGDGYVGYVRRDGLGGATVATHRVRALLTHVYPDASMKTRPLAVLPFLSDLAVARITGGFAELVGGGFVPAAHVAPLAETADDPVAVATRFMDCPYLWGGTTAMGLDCSALVQVSLLACGTACPRDSDMQATGLGRALDDGEGLRRGDLIFWKGHVGMMTDAGTLLHASAHCMAVKAEPLEGAMARIEAAGDGPVTGRRRISPSPAG